MEERPLLPLASEKWPWRQSQPEPKHWAQRNKFLPLEKSYWSPLINEEDGEDVPVPDKTSQQARVNHAWDRHRSAWPVENPLKVPSSWHQDDRSMKLYDRDQSNLAWEKNDNRSDPSRLPTKHESKEKVVLPQITMKTWNSLTSDPATWPHKLPGAKPWPKDENGKSYNPNADLVKKLGLDKQEGNGWSKEEAEKSNAEKKSKDDKRKEEEFPHPNGDRSNFSDYRAKPDDPSKSWTILVESKPLKEWVKPENMQNDEAWRRKHEEKPTWTNDEPASLPKIQSMGAWVMSGDQSTWKPYQMKPLQSPEENSSRRWSKTISRSSSNEGKWPGKGSWSEKMNDSWMDRNEQPLWSEEKQVADLWKPSKPGSWFSKTSKTKDGEWLKPESAWTKINENDSWTAKGNGAPWSMRPNKPWSSKTSNDDVSKFNEESWPVKVKEEEESWKNGDTWPRKSSERNGWGSKGNELSPWQQKMNEDWSYGKSSTGTWPSKWKQFAYHRVTAMPISKPGTTADASSAKSKNAFVAVSAVSSQKNAGNEWRKIEDEGGRNENGRAEEQERSGNQVQVGLERPIYAWKKDPGSRTGPAKGNSTDPLENELEALRQIDFWSSYKENEAEKRSTSTVASAEKIPSTVPTNSTSTTGQRRATGSNNLPETSRRTISMK
nr:uncharacterized protein LOC116432648 [Nomia melanderi]